MAVPLSHEEKDSLLVEECCLGGRREGLNTVLGTEQLSGTQWYLRPLAVVVELVCVRGGCFPLAFEAGGEREREWLNLPQSAGATSRGSPVAPHELPPAEVVHLFPVVLHLQCSVVPHHRLRDEEHMEITSSESAEAAWSYLELGAGVAAYLIHVSSHELQSSFEE